MACCKCSFCYFILLFSFELLSQVSKEIITKQLPLKVTTYFLTTLSLILHYPGFLRARGRHVPNLRESLLPLALMRNINGLSIYPESSLATSQTQFSVIHTATPWNRGCYPHFMDEEKWSSERWNALLNSTCLLNMGLQINEGMLDWFQSPCYFCHARLPPANLHMGRQQAEQLWLQGTEQMGCRDYTTVFLFCTLCWTANHWGFLTPTCSGPFIVH
jgi:hypothetical protein